MIKLVAVQNEEPSTIGCPVMELFRDFHHPALLNKSQHHRTSQKIVMITNGQSNPCSGFRQIHKSSNDQVTLGLPMPATLQTPSVDEVADEIKILRLMSIEKLQ
jgi:hypothetical protein